MGRVGMGKMPNKQWSGIVLGIILVLFFLVAFGQAQANSLQGEQLRALYQGEGDNDVLRAKIAQLMQRELSIADLDKEWYGINRMLEISLPNMPAWVDRQVLIAYRGVLFLVGADRKLERIEPLARTKGEVYVNIAKFDAFVSGAKLTVWSQRPYTASELVAIVQWNGSQLDVVSTKYSDPTADYYEAMAKLLQSGKIEEAMAVEKAVFYPGAYEGYYKIPQLALLKAHENALDKYRAGDAAAAAKVLKWGLDQYLTVQEAGPLSTDMLGRLRCLTEPSTSPGQAYRVDLHEFIAAFNDYAFFLAEMGQSADSEIYLKKVAEMAPDRMVVYINLGDICWGSGKYTEAKEYYRRYLNLLGDEKEAPQRVWDRI